MAGEKQQTDMFNCYRIECRDENEMVTGLVSVVASFTPGHRQHGAQRAAAMAMESAKWKLRKRTAIFRQKRVTVTVLAVDMNLVKVRGHVRIRVLCLVPLVTTGSRQSKANRRQPVSNGSLACFCFGCQPLVNLHDVEISCGHTLCHA